jgi:SAM-dependent methyltransferase
MLQHLKRYGHPVGVEAEAEAVRLCRERGVTAVELAEPPPLPFESERFDLVTALDMLEHVDDDQGLLDEITRVLRPGGQALVAVPAYKFLWGIQDEVSHHKRRYIARQLRERLITSGLNVERLSYFNSLLFPPIGAVRLARRLFKRRPPRITSDFEMNKPGWLNNVLARVFSCEAALIKRVNLPFGVSILALASKPLRGDRRA